MAKEESSKKPSKTLPILIFLIGLALIVGGALMQIGYFGGTEEPTPSESVNENTVEEDIPPVEEVDEGTADASNPDFSNTIIEDNSPIPVKSGEKYTYGDAFVMSITEFNVTCDEESGICGQDGDKVNLKFSTTSQDYDITLTPNESVQNLIDVPVSVEEWHGDYIVIKLTRE